MTPPPHSHPPHTHLTVHSASDVDGAEIRDDLGNIALQRSWVELPGGYNEISTASDSELRIKYMYNKFTYLLNAIRNVAMLSSCPGDSWTDVYSCIQHSRNPLKTCRWVRRALNRVAHPLSSGSTEEEM